MTQPTFPGYSDVYQIGQGGFADVYRAREAGPMGRDVAIKRFRTALDDPASVEQFRHECQAIKRVDSQDVVLVYTAEIPRDGQPYLVMELCGGSLLDEIRRRGPLPVDQVTAAGRSVAAALRSAHEAGVLHGDVTPQNVLYRRGGAAVLSDFGLAVARDYRGNVASGFNPVHAAPEALRSDGSASGASDVYGLGSTLHHALTGQPPFPPRAGERDLARAQRVLTEPAPRAAEAPAWLADLVQRMLAKDPATRPTTNEVLTTLLEGGTRTAPADQRSAAHQPPPPAYGPPEGHAAVSQEMTRDRAGAGAPGGTPDGGLSGEHTRNRQDGAGRRPEPPAPAPNRRWVRPAAVGVAVLVLAAAVLGVVQLLGAGTPDAAPDPAAAPAGPAGSVIRLDPPREEGDAVTLSWSIDRPVADVGVAVARDGAAAAVQPVPRSGGETPTSVTLPVDAGAGYCFQIQGYETNGAVYESNVQPLRGAVCRFQAP
ncbi:serine/threonine-protein kinase [Pseudonocardia broussonetiae]|uniref:non-specific serine/threonine protein kinase n=1 Tax=Pseudonocardia broussonetiae TaxID=2736640 RepID=A0A6M6JKP9_9PSEU|nr:serine/threonine-protein kinase [Pseudonocardia broussonetiae]QJY47936.1 serine/threonine protein kinase [Pseudonocardia broussonetiae]